jgi:hypothetical protein
MQEEDSRRFALLYVICSFRGRCLLLLQSFIHILNQDVSKGVRWRKTEVRDPQGFSPTRKKGGCSGVNIRECLADLKPQNNWQLMLVCF